MEVESTPIVPAQRLLEVAGALADGAARMHEQLRHLDPAERDAILALVAGQVATIVEVWTELVRGVVSAPVAAPTAHAPASPPVAGPSEAPVTPVPAGREHLTSVADPWTQSRPTPPAMQVVPAPAPAGAPPDGPGDAGAPPAGPRQDVTRRAAGQALASPGDAEALSRDELTGVLNRPAGMAALHREIERCRRSGARLVLGYLNVDGLRQVNESHGPRAGDELLRKVTAALRATLRSYDVVLRLGGDEFLFSLPGADVATAEQRFREFAVILGREAPGASASVGFAELHDGDALEDLIARADQALATGRRPRRRVH